MISLVGFIKGILLQNASDRSKQISVEIADGATTNTRTTVSASQTANRTLSLPDATDTLVGKATTDVLTNKTIDADGTGNVISNLDNDNIKASAAIDATKIANGSVSNTEFQYLDGVTSNIQTQLDNKIDSGGTFTDNRIIRADGTNNLQSSAVTLDDSGVMSGASIDADTNAITNIENADIKVGAAIARDKLASGTNSHVLINDGSGVMSSEATLAKVRGGTAQDNTNVTFPSTGVIVTEDGTQVLTNKDIDGGAAANTRRVTLPSGTTSALNALTRKEGTIAYNTTLDVVVYDDGTGFQPVGGGTTPTGDPDSIAFFNASGNLASDATELRYSAADDGIIFGAYDPTATYSVTNHSVAIVDAVGAGAEATVTDLSLIIGQVEQSAQLNASVNSVAHGFTAGSGSSINAINGSLAHGNADITANTITAQSHSHAFGSVTAPSSGADIYAGSHSLAFGSSDESNEDIRAVIGSLAGGFADSGGVSVSTGSIGIGSEINAPTTSANPGYYNQLFGVGHKSSAPFVTKFGRWSVDTGTGNPSTWVSTEPLFVLGNGSSSASKANAFVVDKDGKITTTAAEVNQATRTITSSTTLSARTDRVVYINGGAAVALTLPAGETGLEFIVKDISGAAATNNITFVPNGSDTVEAGATIIKNNGTVHLQFYSGVWRILSPDKYSLGNVQVYTSSTVWNRPSGCKAVLVEVQGGGAAGGGSQATGANETSVGAGGSAGGYTRKWIVGPGSSETVTIGSGGTGVSANTGGSGGTSSFGAHCSATGGTGGGLATASTGNRIVEGPNGGTGSGGDFNVAGSDGGGGASVQTGTGMSGEGAASYFGGGTRGRIGVLASLGLAGMASGSYGGGGSGSYAGASRAATAGGNGSGGIIIVYEYF